MDPHPIAWLVNDPGTLMVELGGELDRDGSLQVEPDLLDVAHDADGRTIPIDVSDLAYVDSSGLRLLLVAHHTAAGGIILVHPKPMLKRLLNVTGLNILLGSN